jgi:hypothetical protein
MSSGRTVANCRVVARLIGYGLACGGSAGGVDGAGGGAGACSVSWAKDRSCTASARPRRARTKGHARRDAVMPRTPFAAHAGSAARGQCAHGSNFVGFSGPVASGKAVWGGPAGVKCPARHGLGGRAGEERGDPRAVPVICFTAELAYTSRGGRALPASRRAGCSLRAARVPLPRRSPRHGPCLLGRRFPPPGPCRRRPRPAPPSPNGGNGGTVTKRSQRWRRHQTVATASGGSGAGRFGPSPPGPQRRAEPARARPRIHDDQEMPGADGRSGGTDRRKKKPRAAPRGGARLNRLRFTRSPASTPSTPC